MGSFFKENKNGIIGTVIFHGIILAVLFLFGFTPEPVEFPDPEGIIIDFGNSEQGSGKIEPENMETNPVKTTNVESNPSITENFVQDFEETVSINENNSENESETPDESEDEQETQPEVIENALYHGDNNVESEGNSEYGGNQGAPDGADTDNYAGNGDGNGISYKLKGRSPVGRFPTPDYPPGNIYGKVIINIKVDKYGKVISVSVGKGTTATDERLIVSAKKAAWKVRFSENFNSIEQTGTITYNFSLK